MRDRRSGTGGSGLPPVRHGRGSGRARWRYGLRPYGRRPWVLAPTVLWPAPLRHRYRRCPAAGARRVARAGRQRRCRGSAGAAATVARWCWRSASWPSAQRSPRVCSWCTDTPRPGAWAAGCAASPAADALPRRCPRRHAQPDARSGPCPRRGPAGCAGHASRPGGWSAPPCARGTGVRARPPGLRRAAVGGRSVQAGGRRPAACT